MLEVVEDSGQEGKGREEHGDHEVVMALDGQELGELDLDRISSAVRASGLAVEGEEVGHECSPSDHRGLGVEEGG